MPILTIDLISFLALYLAINIVFFYQICEFYDIEPPVYDDWCKQGIWSQVNYYVLQKMRP